MLRSLWSLTLIGWLSVSAGSVAVGESAASESDGATTTARSSEDPFNPSEKTTEAPKAAPEKIFYVNGLIGFNLGFAGGGDGAYFGFGLVANAYFLVAPKIANGALSIGVGGGLGYSSHGYSQKAAPAAVPPITTDFRVVSDQLTIPIYGRLNVNSIMDGKLRIIGELGVDIRFQLSAGIVLKDSSLSGSYGFPKVAGEWAVKPNAFQFGLHIGGGAGYKLGPGFIMARVQFDPMFTSLHGSGVIYVNDATGNIISMGAPRKTIDLMFRFGYELGLF